MAGFLSLTVDLLSVTGQSLRCRGGFYRQKHVKTHEFEKIKFHKNSSLEIWQDQADCFERACLARSHPFGAPPLRSGDQNAPRSRILSNRCRRSHPTRPPKNQKAPLSRGSFGFGRTRRIRTADLYHVKADWPHQDTRGHIRIRQAEGFTNPS